MSVHREVEKFLRASGMPPTRFGREAAGDPRLVFDLRRGRQPRAALRSRIDGYIAMKQPASTPRSCAR